MSLNVTAGRRKALKKKTVWRYANILLHSIWVHLPFPTFSLLVCKAFFGLQIKSWPTEILCTIQGSFWFGQSKRPLFLGLSSPCFTVKLSPLTALKSPNLLDMSLTTSACSSLSPPLSKASLARRCSRSTSSSKVVGGSTGGLRRWNANAKMGLSKDILFLFFKNKIFEKVRARGERSFTFYGNTF